MKLAGFLILLFSISGCTASLASADYQNRRGVVKYLNNGADFVIQKRIDDAHAKMRSFCGGDYKVLGIDSQDQFAGTYATTNASTTSTASSYGNTAYGSANYQASTTGVAMYQQYVFLGFECR
jgi:hypothetical protein